MREETTPQNTTPQNSRPKSPSMVRIISDAVPALAFFIAYMIATKIHQPNPILFATMIFLPVAVLGFAFSFWKEKRVSPVGLFIFVMIVIFSGLALWFKSDVFIKARPSFIHGLMGLILLVSVFTRHNLLETIFDGALHLPDVIWRKFTISFGGFYIFIAGVNFVVWKTQSEPTWVIYHAWGDMILTFLFLIPAMIIISKHMTDENGKPLIEQEDEK